jgi:hypothetical protein
VSNISYLTSPPPLISFIPCRLMLYSVTLLTLFMMSSNFLVELDLFDIRSCRLQKGIVWLLPLQFLFLLFLLLILLIWLGIPWLCWIRVESVDTFVSFLVFEEMFSVFLHLVWQQFFLLCCVSGHRKYLNVIMQFEEHKNKSVITTFCSVQL